MTYIAQRYLRLWVEDAVAAWRQVGLYPGTDCELEAIDVAVEHQCRDGRVTVQGDAGEGPGADRRAPPRMVAYRSMRIPVSMSP